MKIHIELNCQKSWEKYLYVTYVFELSQDDVLECQGSLVLDFPVWTPGSYLVREHASQVSLFKATTTSGQRLVSGKISKNQWKIKIGSHSKIKVEYRLYANLFNVRGLYADHEMVFVNPCAAFLFPHNKLNESVQLHISHESAWSVHIGKKPQKRGYTFVDFDEFYDSPLLVTKTARSDVFKVGKTQFRIVYQGYSSIDLKSVTTELKKIVSSQIHIFGEHPCSEYLFQVILGKSIYGGLEHRASSTNMFDGSTLKNPEKFKDFLSLLAHEHFHLWNVKRIRPQALGPFDYSKEAYTRELWIAEGFTRFYDDHSLLRTKLYKPQEYFDLMAQALTKELNQKAYRVDSVALASFDAWIRYYRPDENQANTLTNYYLKGGLIALLLDLTILHKTNGQKSLDDVMLDLYRLYKERPEQGFSRDEFFAFVENYTGESSEDFIQNYIEGTQKLPLHKALVPFGVNFEITKNQDSAYYFGATFKMQNQMVHIASLDEDGPAFHSDLQPFDEIVAINQRRLDSLDGLNHLLDVPKVRVLFCRNGQIYETDVILTSPVKTTVKLKIHPRLTPKQKRMLTCFLRTPYE